MGNWEPASTLDASGYQPGELDLRPGKAASSPLPGTPGGEYSVLGGHRPAQPSAGQHDDHLGLCFQPSRPRD